MTGRDTTGRDGHGVCILVEGNLLSHQDCLFVRLDLSPHLVSTRLISSHFVCLVR
jgi:hypothetical protein